jgi:hypothetical protein
MNYSKLIVWGTVLHFVAISACASASSPTAQLEEKTILASDMAAFSRVIAENPAGWGFPYNVRAVVYANPNDCFESPKCATAKLFLAVIGDGELPDYTVYDAGNASNWTFVQWSEISAQLFDDERDSFVIELVKTLPCSEDNCTWATRPKLSVKARVSLFGFEWLD